MKKVCSFLLGVFIVVSLTGCFGEEYDYSPPTASLSNPVDITQEEKLEEANIDWTYDEKYNKKTKDIQALANSLTIMYFDAGQEVEFILEDGHFDAKDVKISLLGNEGKLDLEVNEAGQTFTLPKVKDDYMVVLDLPTDKGTAQYVGNLVIK